MNIEEKIAMLTREIEDLQKRWPAHSVKPHMVEELERLQDELEELRKRPAQMGHAQMGH